MHSVQTKFQLRVQCCAVILLSFVCFFVMNLIQLAKLAVLFQTGSQLLGTTMTLRKRIARVHHLEAGGALGPGFRRSLVLAAVSDLLAVPWYPGLATKAHWPAPGSTPPSAAFAVAAQTGLRGRLLQISKWAHSGGRALQGSRSW